MCVHGIFEDCQYLNHSDYTFLLITSLYVNLLYTLECACFPLCAPTGICDRFCMKHEMHLLHNWMNCAEKVAEVHGE